MRVFRWVVTVVMTVALTSCGRVQYESQPLASIKTLPKVEEKVGVLYKMLTKKESVAYLGRNWQSRGYQPIQIAIENYSPNPVQYSQKGLSLPTADYETITTAAHQYTQAKAVGIKAPSVACIAAGLVGLILAPATFGISGILVPIGIGGAGLHTASKMIQADSSLDEDYQKKWLHHGEIAGHSVVEGIVFVPKEAFREGVQQKLTMKVLDTKTKQVIVVQARQFKG